MGPGAVRQLPGAWTTPTPPNPRGLPTVKIVAPVLFLLAALLCPAPTAHADYYNYPCNYPAVGSSADVQVVVHGGGQYCDWPMEVNGSHYECRAGGGGVGGGAIGLAPI